MLSVSLYIDCMSAQFNLCVLSQLIYQLQDDLLFSFQFFLFLLLFHHVISCYISNFTYNDQHDEQQLQDMLCVEFPPQGNWLYYQTMSIKMFLYDEISPSSHPGLKCVKACQMIMNLSDC